MSISYPQTNSTLSRFVLVSLTALSLLTLAACGGDGGSDGGGNNGPSNKKGVATPGTVKSMYKGMMHSANNVQVVRYEPGTILAFSAKNTNDKSAYTLTIPLDGSGSASCPPNGKVTLSVTIPDSGSISGPDRIYQTRGSSNCKVTINKNTGKGGTFKGTFKGDLKQGTIANPGTGKITVSNGEFKIGLPNKKVESSDSGNNSGGNASNSKCGSASNCASALVDGTRQTYDNPDMPVVLTKNSSKIAIRVQNSKNNGYAFQFSRPLAKGDTIKCSKKSGALPLVGIDLPSGRYQAQGYSLSGSTCIVTIEKNTGNGGALEASFSGTLVNSSSQSVKISKGFFRVQL